MFSGTTELNMDSKGRLAIPARYRDEILALSQGRLVVTVDPSGCLLIYPESTWEPIAQGLMQRSAFDPRVRAMQRVLVGNAESQEMDAAGRILVSANLRARGQLDKEVALVGQGNKFELWDKQRWDALMGAVEPFSVDDMPASLEGFTL